MRTKFGRWKVWAVLGLSLALAVAVGLGETPPELRIRPAFTWPAFPWRLTPISSVIETGERKPVAELYLHNLDMHAWRNLLWQTRQVVRCECPVVETQGVAFFYDDPGFVGVYAKFPSTNDYTIAVFFDEAPGIADGTGRVDVVRVQFGRYHIDIRDVPFRVGRCCGRCLVVWIHVRPAAVNVWHQAGFDFRRITGLMFVRAVIYEGIVNW